MYIVSLILIIYSNEVIIQSKIAVFFIQNRFNIKGFNIIEQKLVYFDFDFNLERWKKIHFDSKYYI